MVGQLAPEAVRRLAVLRPGRFDRERGECAPRLAPDNAEAGARVIARWGSDLCGLLNALTKGELVALAHALRVDRSAVSARHAGEAQRDTERSWQLRAALWDIGARFERRGVEVSPALQPRPVILGGHLVVQAPPRGMFPTSGTWPRTLPRCAVPAPPAEEPDSLDELLAAADRAIGVRLGPRGRDKGAWGMRAQALLGVDDRGADEPDWRGDVEIKTIPIARDPSGLWRVVEDPAIAMVGAGVAAKLQRTLWLARASIARVGSVVDDADATIVSWYLLEWDAEVARLARRYLHERPKGPRGSDARGHYLSKRFFADCGLLASLNGAS